MVANVIEQTVSHSQSQSLHFVLTSLSIATFPLVFLAVKGLLYVHFVLFGRTHNNGLLSYKFIFYEEENIYLYILLFI